VTFVPPHKRDIAMVFQSYALYPQKTVFENMMFGLRVRRNPRAESIARVHEAAATLSISEILDRKPATLSGGQRQRVALGRAMVRRPRAFLLDEPLSNVDAKLRAEMRVELRSLQQRLGATFVHVTHDQLEAMTMADEIAVMQGGVLLQLGTPEEVYSRPAWRFVAEFIGSPPMNLCEGRIEQGAGGGQSARLGQWKIPLREATESTDCTVGVHFEDLRIVAPPGDLVGRLETIEHLGSEKRVIVRTDVGQIGVRADRGFDGRTGDTIGIAGDVNVMHVFDGNTTARLETLTTSRADMPQGELSSGRGRGVPKHY
jgi:multiple sugar transport system ATP-binding protein